MELGLAGTEWIASDYKTGNVTQYPEHFNATEITDSWESEPFAGIPVVGDIFSAFQFLTRNLSYLFVGFPTFLAMMGDAFITDPLVKTNYQIVVNWLYAIFAIMMTILLIEFIGGRYMTD